MRENGFRADEIDTTKPHPARIYDYLLGGKDNYEVDRQAGEQLIAAAPEVADRRAGQPGLPAPGRPSRRRHRRSASSSTSAPACPPQPNVHEIAQEVAPDIRVVYVDNDPIVHTHAGALLSAAGTTGIVLADLRDPRAILDDPDVRAVIDFDEPVALLLVAVIHFLTDADKPEEIIATLRDALAARQPPDPLPRHGRLRRPQRGGGRLQQGDGLHEPPHPYRDRALLRRLRADRPRRGPGPVLAPGHTPAAPLREIGFYGGVARKLI